MSIRKLDLSAEELRAIGNQVSVRRWNDARVTDGPAKEGLRDLEDVSGFDIFPELTRFEDCLFHGDK